MYKVSMSSGMLALALLPVWTGGAIAQTIAPPPVHLSENKSAPVVSAPSMPSTPALTLPQALERALAANPELSAARRETEAVAASIRQAGVIPNPNVSMAVEDRRRDTRTTAFELSQPIELGGKRAARVAVASRAYDTAQAELQAKAADIRALVITAFFSVLLEQERVRLANAALSIAQRGTDIAGRRVMAGKVSPVEETRARIAEAGVRLEAQQAASDLILARRKLTATWGGNVMGMQTGFQVDGSLNSLPPEQTWEVLYAQLQDAPLMQRARTEIQRWQAQVDVEKSKRIPDVTVSLGMQRNNEMGRDQALFGVSVPLPIFDRNQGNLLEALRRTDKAGDELAAIAIRLDGELAQAHTTLHNAREQARVLRDDILPGAQSAYDAATRGFEFGKFSFLDVLDAQRTLLQTRTQHLRAMADAYAAAAEIDRVLGVSASASFNPSK